MINDVITEKDAEYLIGMVMKEIGLYYDPTGVVKDQDTGQIVNFRDRVLLYSNQPVLFSDTKDRMVFNPLISYKLMNIMFSYFIEKIFTLDGIYYPIVYTTKEEPEEERVALHLKDPDRQVSIDTRYYNNIILAYIEAIGKINGNDYDLSQYDSLEPYRKKRR